MLDIKHKKTKKIKEFKKYGEYGWVKLTDDQYAKLEAKLGVEELDRCIQHVDELAQSSRNKNKWKDWNLVIQRCSREGWGKKTGNNSYIDTIKNRINEVDTWV